MGVVYAGKYSGKRTKLDGKRRILYIQDGQDKIPLTNELVEDVKFKDGNSRDYYRTFTVFWRDGDKSVIKVEKPYVDFLVSGVEVGPQESPKNNLLATIIGTIVIGFLVVVIIGLIADSSKSNSDISYTSQYSQDPVKSKIETDLVDFVHKEEGLDDATEVTRISINEDLGTENPDDYIVLVYPRWNRQNGKDLTSEMIRMHCDTMAKYVSENNPNVHELVLFWNIPYHKEEGVSAKCGYRRNENKLELDRSSTNGLVDLSY